MENKRKFIHFEHNFNTQLYVTMENVDGEWELLRVLATTATGSATIDLNTVDVKSEYNLLQEICEEHDRAKE